MKLCIYVYFFVINSRKKYKNEISVYKMCMCVYIIYNIYIDTHTHTHTFYIPAIPIYKYI